jgi:peptidoglycan/LPS O-acetylase OafA/YrhL
MKLWFPEVDILKATAILLILFGHMGNNVSHYDLVRSLGYYNGVIGLSLFFFISGFLLSQTDSVISSMKAIKKFYMKKFIRIFPLYWVALASLIIIFGLMQINPGHVDPYNFSPDNLLLHFLGLQGIFPFNSIQSMWFVGVIVLFYLVYPIIVCLSKNLFETLAVSSCIFILLVVLHFLLGLINVDALLYYPAFISGILINQIAYSSKKIVDEHFLKKIVFSSLILISVIFLVFVFSEFHQLTFPFFNPQISLFLKPQILLLCAMVPLCTIYLIFTHLFIKIRGKIMSLLSLIAFATYAIYLFQHQFLAVFALITDLFIQNILLQDIVILTFGFAGAILCGIIIQKTELNILVKYKLAHQR